MSKFKEHLKSPHVQIALATGFSIIVLAYVSKRVLPEPIGYLSLAIPPFIATIYGAVISKHKDSKFCATWYWIVAILAVTGLVILFHAV
ncbi:hypothetical protein HQ585_07245 [candidate division KSB1 bacterium]|nr:hypothetical protein [candidate division KSB1 bacterium]